MPIERAGYLAVGLGRLRLLLRLALPPVRDAGVVLIAAGGFPVLWASPRAIQQRWRWSDP